MVFFLTSATAIELFYRALCWIFIVFSGIFTCLFASAIFVWNDSKSSSTWLDLQFIFFYLVMLNNETMSVANTNECWATEQSWSINCEYALNIQWNEFPTNLLICYWIQIADSGNVIFKFQHKPQYQNCDVNTATYSFTCFNSLWQTPHARALLRWLHDAKMGWNTVRRQGAACEIKAMLIWQEVEVVWS